METHKNNRGRRTTTGIIRHRRARSDRHPHRDRKRFGLTERDALEITVKDQTILLSRPRSACIFCGATRSVLEHRGGACDDCLAELAATKRAPHRRTGASRRQRRPRRPRWPFRAGCRGDGPGAGATGPTPGARRARPWRHGAPPSDAATGRRRAELATGSRTPGCCLSTLGVAAAGRPAIAGGGDTGPRLGRFGRRSVGRRGARLRRRGRLLGLGAGSGRQAPRPALRSGSRLGRARRGRCGSRVGGWCGRRRRSRPRAGEEGDGVEIPLRVRGEPDAQVDVGLGVLGVSSLADRPDGRSFGQDRPLSPPGSFPGAPESRSSRRPSAG